MSLADPGFDAEGRLVEVSAGPGAVPQGWPEGPLPPPGEPEERPAGPAGGEATWVPGEPGEPFTKE